MRDYLCGESSSESYLEGALLMNAFNDRSISRITYYILLIRIALSTKIISIQSSYIQPSIILKSGLVGTRNSMVLFKSKQESKDHDRNKQLKKALSYWPKGPTGK